MDPREFLTRIPNCACLMFGSWVLNEIWVIDLSWALVGMLMSSSKLFIFSKEVHLNSGVTLLLVLYCVQYSHQACCLLYIWVKLTVAFTLPIYLWTFTLLFSDVVAVSELNKTFGGSTNLAKKGTDRRICIPLFTPLRKSAFQRYTIAKIWGGSVAEWLERRIWNP